MGRRNTPPRAVLETVSHHEHGLIRRGTLVDAAHPYVSIVASEPWTAPDVRTVDASTNPDDVVVAIESFIADGTPVGRGTAYSATAPIVEARPEMFSRWTPPPLQPMEVR
jgi:hypothetical protein